MKKQLSTKKIVLTALMAALTVVGSALRITIPIDVGGNTSFHLGNIMCALSGVLLGPYLGGLAAGLGSAIFDMMYPAYISEAWLTFLMKGAYGLVAGLVASIGRKNQSYFLAVAASFCGALTYALLYLAKSYFKSILISGVAADVAWLAVLGKLPATIFNGVVAVIFAPILSVAIHKALKRNHISLE